MKVNTNVDFEMSRHLSLPFRFIFLIYASSGSTNIESNTISRLLQILSPF